MSAPYANQRSEASRSEIFKENGALALPVTYTALITATVAEINAAAGRVIIPGVANRAIIVTDFDLICTGVAAGATAIVLQSSNGTPVLVATVPVAAAGNGAVVTQFTASVVRGAGFRVAVGAGDSIVIAKTGATLTGTTTIAVKLEYQIA